MKFPAMTRMTAAGLGLACLAMAGAVLAQEPKSCQTVRFSDVGWTDIAATTGVATTIYEGLGYHATKTIASVPITFAGIRSRQIDVFLGYWSPTMDVMIEPFVKEASVKVSAEPNLSGAKYTLAVPSYVYEAGLRSFTDIEKYGKELDYKIYGVEPGNDGNALIESMLSKNKFNLKKFKMVASSEAGMMVELGRAIRQKKWIVILAWEPHPMNMQYKIDYLSGGDEIFGPNYGEAKVFTVTATDYEVRCPNAARLARNLRFTTGMENQLMSAIMDKSGDKTDPKSVAKNWLKKNPAVLQGWLDGVRTFDGKDAWPALAAYLDGH